MAPSVRNVHIVQPTIVVTYVIRQHESHQQPNTTQYTAADEEKKKRRRTTTVKYDERKIVTLCLMFPFSMLVALLKFVECALSCHFYAPPVATTFAANERVKRMATKE